MERDGELKALKIGFSSPWSVSRAANLRSALRVRTLLFPAAYKYIIVLITQ